MKNNYTVILAVTGLALATGCVTEPGPRAALDTTRYSVENTENFVLLDKVTQASIACTGLQPRMLGDGRLEVVANVKNREAAALQIQINCVFRDEQGLSTNDDTPLQTLSLAGNATEAVRFTATNTLAKKYTIRVRQAREAGAALPLGR